MLMAQRFAAERAASLRPLNAAGLLEPSTSAASIASNPGGVQDEQQARGQARGQAQGVQEEKEQLMGAGASPTVAVSAEEEQMSQLEAFRGVCRGVVEASQRELEEEEQASHQQQQAAPDMQLWCGYILTEVAVGCRSDAMKVCLACPPSQPTFLPPPLSCSF